VFAAGCAAVVAESLFIIPESAGAVIAVLSAEVSTFVVSFFLQATIAAMARILKIEFFIIHYICGLIFGIFLIDFKCVTICLPKT
jgi:hypothetical protein